MGLQRTDFPLGSQSLHSDKTSTKTLSTNLSDIRGPRYALALHTTGPELALGISHLEGESRYQAWQLGRALSTHLHYYLAKFIPPQTWSDLAFIAVAKGPGSFTGTRIGMVTARTLAQQLNLPLFAVSSLAVLAWSGIASSELNPDTVIAVELPARSEEVFAAIYAAQDRSGLTPVLPDTTLTMDKWQHLLDNSSFQRVREGDGLSAEVACRGLMELALQQWRCGDLPHWSEALPFYG